ncbi:MAG: ribosome recycling factor [Acidobacteriota bacterium]
MSAAVDHLHQELKTLRTGRASLAILDGVTVEYYGTPTPLNQVAGLSVADASLITAQPYEPTLIPAIEKAILLADLGLNPSNDGRVIRIPVPQLTEERRKEMVRRSHDMAEATRNSIRQARREGNDALKKLESDKDISQDDERRGQDEVQRLHDKFIQDVKAAVDHKEKDILTL